MGKEKGVSYAKALKNAKYKIGDAFYFIYCNEIFIGIIREVRLSKCYENHELRYFFEQFSALVGYNYTSVKWNGLQELKRCTTVYETREEALAVLHDKIDKMYIKE
jgi:hypothetical protein